MVTKTIELGKKGFAIAASVVVGMSLLVSVAVSAQNSEAGNAGNGNVDATSQQQGKNEDSIKGCENVEQKLDQAKSQLQTKEQNHVQAYNQVKEKVQNYINYAEEKEADTTELKAQLQVLEQKIQNFSNQTQIREQAMGLAKKQACGSKSSEFRGSLFKAQQQLREVRQASLEVKNCIKEELLPEIKEVKEDINS